MKGGVQLRESNPCNKDINPKAWDIPNRVQGITQCPDISSADPFYLLGCTFLINNENTQKHSEVKNFLEEEVKFMVEYVNSGEYFMNYT